MNQQVKAGLSAIRDFLAGRSVEQFAATDDKVTREVVAAELLATMSGRDAGDAVSGSEDQKRAEDSKEFEAERERARQLFLEHGYFDETVLNLRANSAAERAAAARALGLVGSPRGTPHLIAALFDDDPEVRRAAEEALGRIGDASVAKEPEAATDGAVSAAPDGPAGSEIQAAEVERTATAVEQPDVEDKVGHAEDVVTGSQFGALENGVQEVDAMVIGGGRDARGPSEEVDAGGDPSVNVSPVAREATPSATLAEAEMLREVGSARETLDHLQLQLLEAVAARDESEQEIAQSHERESKLRAEAAARRLEEEEVRRQADEKAERRRAQEREALLEEQAARAQAETDAQRHAANETNLRLKIAELKRTTETLARQLEEDEAARVQAAETTRRTEATRARDEAKARHDAELNRLRNEEEWLSAKTEEIVRRHAEVEAARLKADAEAARLVEAEARIRAAEEVRARAEAERMQLEAEIKQRVETARQQLDDTRRRGEEEQERLEDETRRRAEAEQHRRMELEELKARAEANARELAELEHQTLAQVDSLRIADAETRKRIADAEARRRSADEAYRLVAEQVQRVEAEAHTRVQEEEQMRARLEAERRSVAVEAQSRADQERRIREEIEMFRRLEEQERPRIEIATLQRAEAEAHLQQHRQRFKSEEDARHRAEEELSLSPSSEVHFEQTAAAARRAVESLPTTTTPDYEHVHSLQTASPSDATHQRVIEDDDLSGVAPAPVAPAITAYLNSVDPYKRAAAVAELARSRPPDAFALITNCFDDHSPHVRSAAARALRKLEPERSVDLFNRAMEEASPERRRYIGAAIAASGVATEAIENLVGENRDETYSALSILFVMAKTGEVEPLERALAEHPDDEIGRAVAKLLALSGHR